MSSSPLYLAIVLVWIIVLVPMLLRRDVSNTHVGGLDENSEFEFDESRATYEADEEPPLSEDAHPDESSEEPMEPVDTEPEPWPSRLRPSGLTRARVIARRRRRTTAVVLLIIGTVVAVVAGLGPAWVLIPPLLLAGGHVVLLRAAAQIDAERAARRRAHRRQERVKAKREAAQQAAREAEIIELASRRTQVYDQYADAHLRAAGD